MTLEEQLDLFAKAEKAIGKEVDFGEAFSPDQEKRPDDPRQEYAIPEGHESTEAGTMLSSNAADIPNWNKIKKGVDSY